MSDFFLVVVSVVSTSITKFQGMICDTSRAIVPHGKMAEIVRVNKLTVNQLINSSRVLWASIDHATQAAPVVATVN